MSFIDGTSFINYAKCSDMSSRQIIMFLNKYSQLRNLYNDVNMLNYLALKCGPRIIPKQIYLYVVDYICDYVHNIPVIHKFDIETFIQFYKFFIKAGHKNELSSKHINSIFVQYAENSLLLEKQRLIALTQMSKKKGIPSEINREISGYI